MDFSMQFSLSSTGKQVFKTLKMELLGKTPYRVLPFACAQETGFFWLVYFV